MGTLIFVVFCSEEQRKPKFFFDTTTTLTTTVSTTYLCGVQSRTVTTVLAGCRKKKAFDYLEDKPSHLLKDAKAVNPASTSEALDLQEQPLERDYEQVNSGQEERDGKFLYYYATYTETYTHYST